MFYMNILPKSVNAPHAHSACGGQKTASDFCTLVTDRRGHVHGRHQTSSSTRAASAPKLSHLSSPSKQVFQFFFLRISDVSTMSFLSLLPAAPPVTPPLTSKCTISSPTIVIVTLTRTQTHLCIYSTKLTGNALLHMGLDSPLVLIPVED